MKITSKDDVRARVIQNIAVDYITNDMTRANLQKKYNISATALSALITRAQLVRKRETYAKKLLEKSLDKCITKQSMVIVRATSILEEHVKALKAKQRRQKDKMLSSSEIRDVLAILAVVSKEHRLDNDEPTEKIVKQVQVMFPDGFEPITNNQDIIAEAEVVEPKTTEDNEEVQVEIDDNITGGILG